MPEIIMQKDIIVLSRTGGRLHQSKQCLSVRNVQVQRTTVL
jgi:hypothetical protein